MEHLFCYQSLQSVSLNDHLISVKSNCFDKSTTSMNISQRMKMTRSIGMSTEGKTIFEQDNLTKREMYDKFNPNKISLKANSHRSARQHQQAWKGSGWQCTRRWCTWTWASIWTSTCTWPSSPWWKCKTTLMYLNMAVMKRRNNVSLSSTHLVVGLFDCEKKLEIWVFFVICAKILWYHILAVSAESSRTFGLW